MLSPGAIEPIVEDGALRGYRALRTDFRDPDFQRIALKSQDRRRLRRGWAIGRYQLTRLRRAALADLRRRVTVMSRHERLRILGACGRDPAALFADRE